MSESGILEYDVDEVSIQGNPVPFRVGSNSKLERDASDQDCLSVLSRDILDLVRSAILLLSQ